MSKTTTINHIETHTVNDSFHVTFTHKNPLKSREEEIDAERMLENLLEICQAEAATHQKFKILSTAILDNGEEIPSPNQPNAILKDRIEEFMNINGFIGTATITTNPT